MKISQGFNYRNYGHTHFKEIFNYHVWTTPNDVLTVIYKFSDEGQSGRQIDDAMLLFCIPYTKDRDKIQEISNRVAGTLFDKERFPYTYARIQQTYGNTNTIKGWQMAASKPSYSQVLDLFSRDLFSAFVEVYTSPSLFRYKDS